MMEINVDIQHDIYQHCGKPTAKNLHLPIYRRIKRASDLLHDMTVGIPAAYDKFFDKSQGIQGIPSLHRKHQLKHQLNHCGGFLKYGYPKPWVFFPIDDM